MVLNRVVSLRWHRESRKADYCLIVAAAKKVLFKYLLRASEFDQHGQKRLARAR